MWARVRGLLTVAAMLGIGAYAAPAQDLECNSETLTSCPGACIERCTNDDAFYNSNAAECGRLVREARRNPSITDTSACFAVPEVAGNAFSECLRQARAIERVNTGRQELEDLLSTAPTCAQTPFALRQLYVCLSDETDVIQRLFEPITSRGYSTEVDDVEDTGGENPAVCQIDRTQIDADELMAGSLTTQSEILMGEFETVSTCRQNWEVWLNSASAGCSTTETGACQQGISAVIDAMQRDIAPALGREVEIQGVMDDIVRELEEISGVILVRALICPPDGQ